MPWTRKIDVQDELDKSVSDEIRRLTLRIFRGVVMRTPVDTGRLRGAWVVGVNKKPEGEQGGTTDLRKLKRYTDVAYVANNVPYAIYIENGHGGRMPGVMVKATLASIK